MSKVIHVVSPEEARRGALLDGLLEPEVAKGVGVIPKDASGRLVFELDDGSLLLESAQELEARRSKGVVMHTFEEWKSSEETHLAHMIWRRCGRDAEAGAKAWNRLTRKSYGAATFMVLVRRYDEVSRGVLERSIENL